MTRQDMPMLIVYEGQLEGQRWVIDQPLVIIGRGSDCDIALPERQVSRHHAQIRQLIRERMTEFGFIEGKDWWGVA